MLGKYSAATLQPQPVFMFTSRQPGSCSIAQASLELIIVQANLELSILLPPE